MIGHVARFVPMKNHTFLIDVMVEVVKRHPQAYLLLIGDGPLRETIETKVHNVGLHDNVKFLGMRDDVPRLALGAMDVFVFPSISEGLGLALVEAQAAGLPCIFTDIIPNEATVNEHLEHRLSLQSSPAIWAETALKAVSARAIPSRADALRTVEQSSLNLPVSAQKLQHFYAKQSGRESELERSV